MIEWIAGQLGDFIELKRGYDLPSAQRQSGDVPIISSSGPAAFHNEAKVKAPGVVTGRYGTIGQVFYSTVDYWPLNTALYVRDFKGNDPRFTYYFLQTLDWHKFNDKSGVPGVNRNDAHQEPVALPSIAEQRQIAAILGALDDKIEVNRKTAATLEAMARALYRSWFVDFDPVHAKAEGRQPAHMDAATAALFPDRFGDNGLPLGWESVPYLDRVEIVSGGTPKTSEPSYWGGDIPWYSVVDAPKSGDVFVHGTDKNITKEGFDNSAVKMVSRGTTIISARGTVGKLAMAGRDMVFNQSCYGLRGLKPLNDAFVYFATEYAVEHLQSMAHGSVFATITRKTFENLELTTAPNEVHVAYDQWALQMLDRVHGLGRENATLTNLRDTLLPRLMSGELRVGAAEKIVSEAV